MHLLAGADRDRLIFGPYFLVPFGLVVALLLLEIGLVSSSRATLQTALAIPMGLLLLAGVGHRDDPVYQGFLREFTHRLGGDPLYLTLLASVGFYLVATLRRVPFAVEGLTAVLGMLAAIGPDPVPLLAAGVVQIVAGVLCGSAWRCLVGSATVTAAATLALPPGTDLFLRGLIAFHLLFVAVLIIGAVFDDRLARVLRLAAPAASLAACLTAMSGVVPPPSTIPDGWSRCIPWGWPCSWRDTPARWGIARLDGRRP
jgi:hypothetical protein